jgi:tetratricopeptide (TPR) repeat protein
VSLRALALLLIPGLAAAQHQHAPPPDDSRIDLVQLPQPKHMDGIGDAHIPITTKSPETQQWFDQGLRLLHCFWDYEALKAFEQSVRLDPDCAMCHWGVAGAINFRGGSDTQSKEEMDKAKQLGDSATDLEQRYIAADLAARDKKGDEAAQAYSREMEALISRYPDDLQAKVLLALHANRGYESSGDPRSGTLYSQALLSSLLTRYPEDAAVNHYWIHAVEDSAHPEWAMDSAAKLGRLAPASGHMVHMPGHIYYRTGDYEHAREIFLAAKRVDEDYLASQHVTPRDDWNYAHNLSYLAADCAEAGRYAEAVEHARSLRGLYDDPGNSGNPTFYVLQIASTEARLAIRYGKWQDAIDHPMNFGVDDAHLSAWARGYRDGLVAYARGMLALEQDRLDDAAQSSLVLDAQLWRLSKEDVPDKDDYGRTRTLKLLGVAAAELRGTLVAKKGDYEGARKILRKAADDERDLGYSEPPQYARPVLEVLADAAVRAGKFDDALAAYREDLILRPKAGFALYGIAAAYDQAGQHNEAKKAFVEFLAAWAHADPDLPQVRAAAKVQQ